MSRINKVLLGGFLVNGVMIGLAASLADVPTRLTLVAVLIAYGSLMLHILGSEEQTRVRQRHHDEIMGVLRKIASKGS